MMRERERQQHACRQVAEARITHERKTGKTLEKLPPRSSNKIVGSCAHGSTKVSTSRSFPVVS